MKARIRARGPIVFEFEMLVYRKYVILIIWFDYEELQSNCVVGKEDVMARKDLTMRTSVEEYMEVSGSWL